MKRSITVKEDNFLFSNATVEKKHLLEKIRFQHTISRDSSKKCSKLDG